MRQTFIAALLLIAFTSILTAKEEDNLAFGNFGRVTLYREMRQPSNVVLLLSGEDPSNEGTAVIPKEIAKMDTLVVGVYLPHYLNKIGTAGGKCAYPAADFEALSKFVQKSLEFPAYIAPVLIGDSSGGSLVYAILAEAPPNTFRGGISLGFCPDLNLQKLLCRGYGYKATPAGKNRYRLLPFTELQASWTILQRSQDQLCEPSNIREFAKAIPNARLIKLPGDDPHDPHPDAWMAQLRSAYRQLTEKAITEKRERSMRPVAVKDLPLVEVSATAPQQDLLAVIVTGDGGWASIDRDIGTAFAQKGIPVVGFNSLQYFWTRRSAEQSSEDLNRVIQHYLSVWKKSRAIVVGYSLGADVLPFMITRLPAQTAGHIALIALLGPSRSADFEFHLTDWLGSISHKNDHPVLPEIKLLKDKKVVCLFSEDETDSVCREVQAKNFVSLPLRGGHHFGGAFQSIADRILKQL